jgi:hypothetical protein
VSVTKLVQFTIISLTLIALNACFSVARAEDESDLPTIIAIGDMHGDYKAYKTIMLATGLIDTAGNWSGGDTIFVQTGDIPDRGPDSRKIIENLRKLEQQAPNAGGKLIPLVGNHEAMNVVRDLRYVHPGEYAAFADDNSEATRDAYYLKHQNSIEEKALNSDPSIPSADIRAKWYEETPLGKVEHEAAWHPDGQIGSWIKNNMLVAKVGSYLFAHGGFSQEFSAFSLADLNNEGRAALIRQDWSKDSILRHSLGPLWYRGNVRGREDVKGFSRKKELQTVLSAYGATHVIIGHTRNEKGIRVSLNGRLFQIDTGASAHYGGALAFLRIEGGEFFAHTIGRETQKLKAAK